MGSGMMIIAEVASRFSSIKEWLRLLRKLGLKCTKMMESEKNYFNLFILKKKKKHCLGALSRS